MPEEGDGQAPGATPEPPPVRAVTDHDQRGVHALIAQRGQGVDRGLRALLPRQAGDRDQAYRPVAVRVRGGRRVRRYLGLRPEGGEVDAQRDPADAGRADPLELGGRERGRDDDAVGEAAEAAVHDVRRRAQREPAWHPRQQDGVQAFVGEQYERHAAPAAPPGQPAKADLVADLEHVRWHGVQQPEHPPSPGQDPVVPEAGQAEAAHRDALPGRRLLHRLGRPRHDEHPLMAGLPVAAAEFVERDAQAA
jgi:hypothetical protein